jgi:hypothetical protein
VVAFWDRALQGTQGALGRADGRSDHSSSVALGSEAVPLSTSVMVGRGESALGSVGVTWANPRASRHAKVAAVLVNSQAPIESMVMSYLTSFFFNLKDELVSNAWTMFSSRAFVHQYVAHGLVTISHLHQLVVVWS